MSIGLGILYPPFVLIAAQFRNPWCLKVANRTRSSTGFLIGKNLAGFSTGCQRVIHFASTRPLHSTSTNYFCQMATPQQEVSRRRQRATTPSTSENEDDSSVGSVGCFLLEEFFTRVAKHVCCQSAECLGPTAPKNASSNYWCDFNSCTAAGCDYYSFSCA